MEMLSDVVEDTVLEHGGEVGYTFSFNKAIVLWFLLYVEESLVKIAKANVKISWDVLLMKLLCQRIISKE